MGSGKFCRNPIYCIFWFFAIFVTLFLISGLCAFLYIIIFPCTTCVDACTPLTDVLLKGVQLPHYCAQQMVNS